MNKTNVQIISILQQFLQQVLNNKVKYVNREEDFSRRTKLTFSRVAGFILNLPKKSLSIELADFYEGLGLGAWWAATKSAFSKARKKLKAVFFIDWNEVLLKEFYTDNEQGVKTWLGHTLLGVDGSTATLFNAGDIAAHFGYLSEVVMGRVMSCIDVLNGLCILAKIAPINVSEMQIAKEWIQALKGKFSFIDNPLVIFDRGFAGFALAYILVQEGIDFVIRYSVGFNQLVYDFMRSDEEDCVIDFPISTNAVEDLKALGYEVDEQTSIKVRLVKVVLDTAEVEVLVTSLTDQAKYPLGQFKALYFKRWGTETNYDYWKNKAQLEIVSGHTVQAILQDFHATVMTANIHSLIIRECEPELEQINEGRQYDYAVNKNVGLGMLKGRIFKLFLLPEPEQILTELKLLFLKHLEPVRPDRSYKRDFKKHKLNGKYVTFTNYRRAL